MPIKIRISKDEAIAVGRLALGLTRSPDEILSRIEATCAAAGDWVAPERCRLIVTVDATKRKSYFLTSNAEDGKDVKRCRALAARGVK
jgi:hypothetical protein